MAHALELASSSVNPVSTVILITDGRANVPSRTADPWADALETGAKLNCSSVLVDSSLDASRAGNTEALAAAMGVGRFISTVDGQTPVLFSPDNPPAIVTTQGSAEDWTIENRSMENHEFHIHQVHFLVLKQDGVSVNNGQYLDMIQVPYWPGSGPYPSVTVRMDFRGPLIGDFVYHCHILGHEDSGMMAIIRVNPPHHERR